MCLASAVTCVQTLQSINMTPFTQLWSRHYSQWCPAVLRSGWDHLSSGLLSRTGTANQAPELSWSSWAGWDQTSRVNILSGCLSSEWWHSLSLSIYLSLSPCTDLINVVCFFFRPHEIEAVNIDSSSVLWSPQCCRNHLRNDEWKAFTAFLAASSHVFMLAKALSLFLEDLIHCGIIDARSWCTSLLCEGEYWWRSLSLPFIYTFTFQQHIRPLSMTLNTHTHSLSLRGDAKQLITTVSSCCADYSEQGETFLVHRIKFLKSLPHPRDVPEQARAHASG